MPPFDPSGQRRPNGRRTRRRERPAPSAFVLYVEGPRDRDLLRIWAQRLSPGLARRLDPCAVILGGRQPARALEHFRRLGGGAAGFRGLMVLDRDHHTTTDGLVAGEPGLEQFVWGRRHIESYVLVRSAISRLLAARRDAASAERLVEDLIPSSDDEAAHRELNAKHLLGSKGPLARGLGLSIAAGEIARCMRAEEIHGDVLDLYGRIREGLGLSDAGPEVVRRPRA